MKKIIAVSAIVDTRAMTIYTNTGETVTILQGDPRLAVFVKALQEGIKKAGDTVELDLDLNSPEPVETAPSKLGDFDKFEQQSGLVKFFKVAKKAVSKFFSQEKEKAVEDEDNASQASAVVAPLEIGRTFDLQQAVSAVAATVSETVPDTQEEEVVSASSIEEVMAHAKAIPASSPDFRMTASEEKTHDVVAVVTKEDGSLGIVPNAHKLATQVAHAAETGKVKGVEALLKRMAALSTTRQHSVEDLLKFIQRGDLPVTDDGRIVYYKLLNSTSGTKFGFTDIHTGKVPQGPGVRVQMAESLVDPNRRNECSNGLHVARRQYLGGFGGDSCILGSLNPEDVIAVPDYDANKMRVKGYDLHFLLSPDEFKMVKSNTPFPANSQAAKMLALIIAGKQPPITHVVNIGGHRGSNITITETSAEAVAEEEVTAAVAEAEPVAPIEEVVPHNAGPSAIKVTLDAEKIDPTQLAKKPNPLDKDLEVEEPEDVVPAPAPKPVEKQPAKAAPVTGSPRAKIAALLASEPMSADLAQKVNAIKRAAKKGWDKLGVDATTEAKIKSLL